MGSVTAIFILLTGHKRWHLGRDCPNPPLRLRFKPTHLAFHHSRNAPPRSSASAILSFAPTTWRSVHGLGGLGRLPIRRRTVHRPFGFRHSPVKGWDWPVRCPSHLRAPRSSTTNKGPATKGDGVKKSVYPRKRVGTSCFPAPRRGRPGWGRCRLVFYLPNMSGTLSRRQRANYPPEPRNECRSSWISWGNAPYCREVW